MKANYKFNSNFLKEIINLYPQKNTNTKKKEFSKSLSEILTIPTKYKNNKINLKKNNAKINTNKLNLPLINSHNNNHIILLNNVFYSKTLDINKTISSNCFNSKKPLENKKYKNKIVFKKNKHSVNIYNIRLENEFQNIHNIRYYNLNLNLNSHSNNIINNADTNYSESYNKNINSIYMKNKRINIKEYNIFSPYKSSDKNLKFNNDKLNKLYEDKKLNVTLSLIQEKSKIKKNIKKLIFHNVFFKWKKYNFTKEDKLNIMNNYVKYLKLSIKSEIKNLVNVLKKNKNNVFEDKEIKNKVKRNKSSLISNNYPSFYYIINNINQNKKEINDDNKYYNKSVEIKNLKNNIINNFKRENYIIKNKKIVIKRNNNNTDTEKIDEVEEDESYIDKTISSNNFSNNNNNKSNYFSNIIKSRRNINNLENLYDNNLIKSQEGNIYFKTFQKSIVDNNKEEKINQINKNAFSMENFYFKDNMKNENNNYNSDFINDQIYINKNGKISNNYNDLKNNLQNNNKKEKEKNIEIIGIINHFIKENEKKNYRINNNTNDVNINNIINNNENIVDNDNITNNIVELENNNDNMTNNNCFLNSKITMDSINNKIQELKTPKIKKSKEKKEKNILFDIFSDYDNIINNKKELSVNINRKNIIKNIKEKNNISEIEIDNSYLNKTYPIIIVRPEFGKKEENKHMENKPYIELRRDSLNKNFYECQKKFKKRKSVDYIYIANDNNSNNNILEKKLSKMKFKRMNTLGLDSQKNLNLVIKINEKRPEIKNNKPIKKANNIKPKKIKNKNKYKNKNQNKKKTKKKKRNKINIENDKKEKEENDSNIKENADIIEKDNYENNNFQKNEFEQKKSNKKLYQYNKKLDFLENIPKKTREQIEKENEIHTKHKIEAFNYLMKNNINNLVKKKRKSCFFNLKKLNFKFKIKEKEKERNTPPSSLKRRRTKVLDSEKYLSKLLKKQLIMDNSYLFKKEQKTKIYKGYDDIIALIPEKEKKNIIIKEIKDKKQNIGKQNKNNIKNIRRKSITKIEEEKSKIEEESSSMISSKRSNKIIRRSKPKFPNLKKFMSKFMNNDDENKNDLRKEETEKEKREKLLMEKLYNFFGKIQKMKKSEDENEVNEFINEEIEKKGINERRQRFLRLNSFIDDINYLKNLDKLIKPKIKYLSPLCFSSPYSLFNKN